MVFKTHFNKYFSSFGIFCSTVQKHTVTARRVEGTNTGLKVSGENTDTEDATGYTQPKIPLPSVSHNVAHTFTVLCFSKKRYFTTALQQWVASHTEEHREG